jgi:hypothetical protein
LISSLGAVGLALVFVFGFVPIFAASFWVWGILAWEWGLRLGNA